MIQRKDIFEHIDYKTYLLAWIASKPKQGRGVRMAWAAAISCPISHLSQVLGRDSHLSLDQAEATNCFIGHTDTEANFFLILVQLGRAGTSALKQRLNRQIEEILKKRWVLKERLGVKTSLSREDQAIFYSSWHYGAIHVMLSIERFRKKDEIARYLGVSLKRATEVLEFLVSVGLAVSLENGAFAIGTTRIHLENDSPMISKFHTNWRVRAIQSLDSERASEDLHYSSAVTISNSDFTRIKSLLIKNIQDIKSVIQASPEEGVHCFNIDFFRI